MSALSDITTYLSKKRSVVSKDKASVVRAEKATPVSKINTSANDSVTSKIWNTVKDGPMGNLGKDFIAEQVAVNGHTILNNAGTSANKIYGPIAHTVEQVKDQVFNAVALAMIAQDQMAMYFLQQTGKEVLKALKKKREILLVLKEKLRQLYNALVLLTAGSPFFIKYLAQLRKALLLIWQAKKDIKSVADSLAYFGTWQSRKFEGTKKTLEEAMAQLEPKHTEQDPKKRLNVAGGGLLANVGIPKKPEQLMILLLIPKLCKEVTLAANGYFVATLRVNVGLLAFCLGWQQLIDASSGFIKKFTLGTLSNVMNQLQMLIDDMALTLNGDSSIIEPNPDYNPDSIKVSTMSLNWVIQLRVIYEFLRTVPGHSLNMLDNNSTAVNIYKSVVAEIKTLDNVNSGGAVLQALDGREILGQLETQVVSFVLSSLKACVVGETASTILSLGRILQKRLDLSLERDNQIETLIQKFVSHELGFKKELAAIGNGIDKLLRDAGMGKAADNLKGGKFKDFFDINSKTMTYAGAAMVGLSLLKDCLETDEDRAKLDRAQLQAEQDNRAAYRQAQRSVASSHSIQKAKLDRKDKDLSRLETDVLGVAEQLQSKGKCDIPEDFKPTNLVQNLGPVVGISLFGTDAVQDNLTKYGKGVI